MEATLKSPYRSQLTIWLLDHSCVAIDFPNDSDLDSAQGDLEIAIKDGDKLVGFRGINYLGGLQSLTVFVSLVKYWEGAYMARDSEYVGKHAIGL